MNKKQNMYSQAKNSLFTLSPLSQVIHIKSSECCPLHLDFTNYASMLNLQCILTRPSKIC